MSEFGSDFEKESPIPDRNLDKRISPESEHTMNELFKDDFDGVETKKIDVFPMDINPELEMKTLFADDFSEKTEGSDNNDDTNETEQRETVDLTKQYEPNSKFEVEGRTYETDDNGYIYKIDGYELLPNSEYTIDGVTYKTDDHGRIVSCDGQVKSTPDGERDLKAQNMAGGEDRKPGDQGGHIIARVLGGSKGIENMLAMRGPINQGPYSHMMEKELIEAAKEGKDVRVHVDVKYDGDSQRPSKIIVTYIIDGKETVMEYDNDEGSTDLLDSIEDKVDDEQYQDLRNEIDDANADGAKISIIAVKIEYDDDGKVSKVTVIMRDENDEHPQNEPRVLLQKEDQ